MPIRSAPLTLLCLLLSHVIWSQGIITTLSGTDYIFDREGAPAAAAPIGPVFGVALGPTGDLYLASPTQNIIFRVAAAGTLHRFAGNGIKGFSGEGAPAGAAALNFPTGAAVALDGTIYVADFENHVVRRIRNDGVIETVAGNANAVEIGDGGAALLASLYVPTAVAIDAAGLLYIADNGNHRIRRVGLDGIIQTIAGTGDPGYSGDGGPATQAQLSSPQGIAVDANGNVYFSDAATHTVRLIGTDGVITTLAGTGAPGFSGDGGPAAKALFNEPRGIALDPAGALYIADSMNHRLRRISKDGAVTTLAGTGEAGFSGDDGPAAKAACNEPSGVTIAPNGSIYLADLANARVRRISPDGRIFTVAGNGLSKFSGDGGLSTAAVLDSPQGIGASANGAILIADSVNNRIRRISPDGVITTIAGTGEAGFSGDGGPASAGRLRQPQGSIVEDKEGAIYFSDRKNNRVRKVGPDGILRTVAGNGDQGFSGDGGPATLAALNFPADLALDASGNLYIADRQNHRIRRVQPNGVIDTVAGTGEPGFSGDGGPARNAQFREPSGITLDAAGNLYICDFENARVRRVSPNGIIQTIAGNGDHDFTGDGEATEVGINGPYKAIFDARNRLLIADVFGARIRRLDTNGLLETIAGTGEQRFFGDGDIPANAGLNLPVGLALRPDGVLLIADAGNDRIRGILPAPPSWTLSRSAVTLAARTDGPPPAPETVIASSTIPGVRFTARAETASGGPWLSVTAPASFLSQMLSISASPQGLAPGEYKGQIVIETPSATPAQARIDVTLSVTGAQGPALDIAPGELLFSLPDGQSEQQLVLLRNRGVTPVSYEAVVEGAGAAAWMEVDSGPGIVSPADPRPILLRARPSNLPQGEYTASLRLTNKGTAEISRLPVRLVVTSPQPILRLGQNGLSFQAQEGPQAADFPQKIGVLNTGNGAMPWDVTVVETNGPVPWITLSNNAGVSEGQGKTVPEFTVSIRAGGMAVGEYRARLRVSAHAAGNPAEFVDIVLNVIRSNASPRPFLTRSGLISVVAEGQSSPPSMESGLVNLQLSRLDFRSIRGTFDGGNWLDYRPAAGSLEFLQSVGITVQTNPASLLAGVYEGVMTFMFLNQEPRNLKVLLLVTPRPMDTKSAARAAIACDPTSLEMVFTRLASGFSVKPGQPVAIEVQAADNCGTPLRDGMVLATFDDGGKPVRLTPLQDGRWSGTWIPAATVSPRSAVARVIAVTPSPRPLQKEIDVTGRIGTELQR